MLGSLYRWCPRDVDNHNHSYSVLSVGNKFAPTVFESSDFFRWWELHLRCRLYTNGFLPSIKSLSVVVREAYEVSNQSIHSSLSPSTKGCNTCQYHFLNALEQMSSIIKLDCFIQIHCDRSYAEWLQVICYYCITKGVESIIS